MNHMFVTESSDNLHLLVYATEASQVLHPLQRRSGTVQEAKKLFFLLCEDGNPRHDDKVLLLIDGFVYLFTGYNNLNIMKRQF